MDEDFGSNFVTIEDEEGNEFELEEIGSVEYNDQEYTAFLPADMDENDPDYGYIFLKITEEGGEELFSSVDDDEELSAVYELFMKQLFEDEESDESEDEKSDE